MQSKTKRLTESAMLLAVAIVLELVSKMFIPEMPFGGQITLVSMLPVVLISYRHVQKGTPVTTAENIVFLVLYVGMGFVGFQRALDFLPIIASVFNMLAVFQRDEQKTRILVLFNASIFCLYYIIIGSTSLLAELLAVITTVVGLIRYRKKA